LGNDRFKAHDTRTVSYEASEYIFSLTQPHFLI